MADPVSNLDPYKIINFTQNQDGSLTRLHPYPTVPATPQLTSEFQLTLSKDIPLNPTNSTFLRLYRPVSLPASGKLPIIIYFYGGGFIQLSPASVPFHDACSTISAQSPTLIVSVKYRLAPEHRLPAAYEDAVEAVLWVRNQALGVNGRDEWLTELADFSKVYIMGSSSGGNIAYNVCLRVLDLDLNPIKIVGLIFNQPFFGGVECTETEIRLANDPKFPLIVTDLIWSLALPEGSDKDHEYCNPLRDIDISRNEKIKQLPRCLVRGNFDDPFVNRQKDFAYMLETHGVHVTKKFGEGYHGIQIFEPQKAQLYYDEVKSFISSSC